jgi:hypothetical protein
LLRVRNRSPAASATRCQSTAPPEGTSTFATSFATL